MEIGKCMHGNGPECERCKAMDIPEVEDMETTIAEIRAELVRAQGEAVAARQAGFKEVDWWSKRCDAATAERDQLRAEVERLRGENTALDDKLWINFELRMECLKERDAARAQIKAVIDKYGDIEEDQSLMDVADALQSNGSEAWHQALKEQDKSFTATARAEAAEKELATLQEGLELWKGTAAGAVRQLKTELTAAESTVAGMRRAAQAVIDRWDSPKWKDQDPTAKVINELRAAVTAGQADIDRRLKSDPIKTIWDKLAKSKEYREEFVAAQVKRGIPMQIRALMKQHGLTQAKLSELSGLTQGVVSRSADPNYGNLTLNTIIRIAAGFDIAFIGSFVPFSDLAKWFVDVDEDGLQVKTFTEESINLATIIYAVADRLEVEHG